MNLREKALKGVFWSAVEKWGYQIVAILVFFLLARLLSPEDFGLVALASVFISFTEIFLDQGFAQAIIQRQHLEAEHLDTAFWFSIGIGILLTAIVFLFTEPIAQFFKSPQLVSIIRWLSVSFIFRALCSVQEALLRRNLDFKAISMRTLLSTVLGGVVGIVMALMNFGVWSLIGKELTFFITACILLWRISPWRPSLKFSQKHFNDLFLFGINILGLRLLSFFNLRGINLVIGYFLGTTALGYFTLANRILSIVIEIISSTTSQVTMSAFARLQDNLDYLRKAFLKVTRLIGFVSFPIFFILSVLAHEVVMVTFGSKWIESVPIIQFLAFYGLIQSVSLFNGNLMSAIGKPSWDLAIRCVDTIFSILLVLTVFKEGIVAVSMVYTIQAYLLFPLQLIAVRKLIGMRIRDYLYQYRGPIAGALLATTVAMLVKILWGTTLPSISVLVLSLLLSMVAYFSMILLCDREILIESRMLIQDCIPLAKR
jgi:O-antigen/teichoic acid export membrane protein